MTIGRTIKRHGKVRVIWKKVEEGDKGKKVLKERKKGGEG
jgi:hypothetical protein